MRKLILDKVRQLGPTEHQEIFSLLQEHGIAFSSNSNGVFINLSTVPDDVLMIIKAFVEYCAINKAGLDEYEKKLQECKITHKFDSISTLADGNRVSTVDETSPAPVEKEDIVVSATQRCSHSSTSTVNSFPSLLVTGRFQATKKRFSRRKIVDRKQALLESESGVLMPEPYTYVRSA